MIFATQSNTEGYETIVGAADTVAESEEFYIAALEMGLFLSSSQPSITEMLFDERFRGLKKAPYVFLHEHEQQRVEFTTLHNLKLMPVEAMRDKHITMMRKVQIDPYLSSDADKRTIGEIFGLDKFDPFDARTEEEKIKDDEYKAKAESAKKAGKLTGDSFGGKKAVVDDTDLNVRRIDVVNNDDGSCSMTGMLATKGLFDDNGKGAWLPRDTVADADPKELFYRFQLVEQASLRKHIDACLGLSGLIISDGHGGEGFWLVVRGAIAANRVASLLDSESVQHSVTVIDLDGNDSGSFVADSEIGQQIEPSGHIAIYYRLDITGAMIAPVLQALGADDKFITGRGQTKDLVWLVVKTKLVGEKLAATLMSDPSLNGIEIDLYSVSDHGVRMVPKGVEIVGEDTPDVHPRPWNDRAGELVSMTEEELAANNKAYRAEEFFFCGSYEGANMGTTVYIVPCSYFKETGEMWEGSLDLVGHLPSDLKEVRAGIYRSYSRDYVHISHALLGMGMIESMRLQLCVNCL